MSDGFDATAAWMAKDGVRLLFVLDRDGEGLLALGDNMPRLSAVDVLRAAAGALLETADRFERDEASLLAEVTITHEEDA